LQTNLEKQATRFEIEDDQILATVTATSRAMEEVAAKILPQSYAGEWTDTALQEKRAEGKTTNILGFALLFAYLFLVALYESWTIAVPVLLSVAVGILGSFGAIVLTGVLSSAFLRSRRFT
jgi:multidrug efflux pump subunit AcrB